MASAPDTPLFGYYLVTGAPDPALGASVDLPSGQLVGLPKPVGIAGDALTSFLVSSIELAPLGQRLDGSDTVQLYAVDTRGYLALAVLAAVKTGLPFTWVGQLSLGPGFATRQLLKCPVTGELEATLEQLRETLLLVLPPA